MPSGPLLLRSTPYDTQPGAPLLLKSYVTLANSSGRYKPWARVDSLLRPTTPQEAIRKCEEALSELDKRIPGEVIRIKVPKLEPPGPPGGGKKNLKEKKKMRPQSAVAGRKNNSNNNKTPPPQRTRPQSANPRSTNSGLGRGGLGRGGYDVTRLSRLTKIPGKKTFDNLPEYRWPRNRGKKLASDEVLKGGLMERIEGRDRLDSPIRRKTMRKTDKWGKSLPRRASKKEEAKAPAPAMLVVIEKK